MESFHIIVLVVASVSLILVLTVAGILIKKDKGSQKFPTSHKDVPDGWTKAETSEGIDTKHTLTHTGVPVTAGSPIHNYTNPTRKGTDTDNKPAVADGVFTGPIWKDIDICKKKKWADKNQVYWDGITTYNGC